MMKPSTKDKVVGKFHEVKGKVRETAGQLTNNPGLQAEGTLERPPGRFKGSSARWRNPWKNSIPGQ